MPPVSKAGAFLLVLVVTSSVLTLATTTGVVAASSATTIGGKNDLSLVRKIKNSKKTNANANANKGDTCTMEPFLGTSQYTNCKGEEMEVKIACDTTDNTATATNTTPTTRLCSYSEEPVQYEDAAAVTPQPAATGCGDHGSFDPETHLSRDHATGMCRLKFLRLTSTCIGAPASSGFGVMVEVPPRTGTGLHNHDQNENNGHKDNSGLMLQFSTDGGLTYYNNQTPRTTAFLDRSSPRQTRTLETTPCRTACGKFGGKSTISPYGKTYPFETCYQINDESTYCWTKSYYKNKKEDGGHNRYYQCVPIGDAWHDIDAKYVNPVTQPNSCGDPCQEHYQKKEPTHSQYM